MEIGALPDIVDYEASGYDESTGCSYKIDVYLIDVYTDDSPDMSVDFVCRFLEGGLTSSYQSDLARRFRMNKVTLAEFCHVIQWLSDADDIPLEAGATAVRLVTRDLIFACPRARTVVSIITVDFIGWEYLYNHHVVDRDLVAAVAASVAAAMQAGSERPAARAAVEALQKFVIRDLETETTPYCVVCMDEFSVGSETTRMPCSHLFHPDCIVRWLRNRCECPLCRFQLPSSEIGDI